MDPQLNVKNVLYHNDYVNPAPNIGLTWNPRVEDGLLAKLLGHNKSVFSAAYRISYYDEGMNAISKLQSGSPGATQSVTGSSALAANPGAYSVGGAAASADHHASCFSSRPCVQLRAQRRIDLAVCESQSGDAMFRMERTLPAGNRSRHCSQRSS